MKFYLSICLCMFFSLSNNSYIFSMEKSTEYLEEKQMYECMVCFSKNFLGESHVYGTHVTKLINKKFVFLCDFDVSGFGNINSRYSAEKLGAKKFALLCFIFKNSNMLFKDPYFIGIIKRHFKSYLSEKIVAIEAKNLDKMQCNDIITQFFDEVSGKIWDGIEINWDELAARFIHVCFDLFWLAKDSILAYLQGTEKETLLYLLDSADIDRESKNLTDFVYDLFSGLCCVQ